jgi:hypothetical protein
LQYTPLVDWFSLAEAPFDIATIVGMGWVEGLNLTPLTFVVTVVGATRSGQGT